jgi:hypothetical protein
MIRLRAAGRSAVRLRARVIATPRVSARSWRSRAMIRAARASACAVCAFAVLPGSASAAPITASSLAAATAAIPIPSALVNTIDTSRWSPASPDPSGLAYDATANRLLVSDGEVDEMSIYKGVNYYESTLGGTVTRTTNTLAFTNEPTGVAFDARGRVFVTDDDQRRVFQITLGDGHLDGSDPRTSFGTAAFGSNDPEGVAYDPVGDRLFIADGEGTEIYTVLPVDGVFGNGNDQVTHFDTAAAGVIDPETVEFNPDSGTLFTIGGTGDAIVELTTSGSVVSEIDTSYLPFEHASGLTSAPRSTDATKKSFYISDRRVDNDNHPTENDGLIYEVAAGAAAPPTGDVRVAAGSDDAEEAAGGAVSLSSSDLEMVLDGSVVQTVGMRFARLGVPAGATVTGAYVQFVADESQSEATALTIRGQAADNAPAFTTASRNVSSRAATSAAVSWQPPAWTAGAAGAAQRTPDLASVVQEVVNRPGWASGNALALVVSGSGHRTAVAFEGGAANTALLHVDYR